MNRGSFSHDQIICLRRASPIHIVIFDMRPSCLSAVVAMRFCKAFRDHFSAAIGMSLYDRGICNRIPEAWPVSASNKISSVCEFGHMRGSNCDLQWRQ